MAKESAIVTLTPARLRSACRWLAQSSNTCALLHRFVPSWMENFVVLNYRRCTQLSYAG